MDLNIHLTTSEEKNSRLCRVRERMKDGNISEKYIMQLKRNFKFNRWCPSSPPKTTLNSTQFDQINAQIVVAGLAIDSIRVFHFLSELFSNVDYSISFLSRFHQHHPPQPFHCNIILREILAFHGHTPALSFYHRVRFRPDNHTFPLLLAKIFPKTGAFNDGCVGHGCVVKSGFESDVFVRNSLVHMYSAFMEVESARRVFDVVGFDGDLVMWNSMVDGYVKNGMVVQARKLFDEMPERDGVSWNTIICGYAGVGEMEVAEELFHLMPRTMTDVVTWNSLLGGYAKRGEIVPARVVFNTMPHRNLVSWNTILALYVRKGDFRECLRLFQQMTATGVVRPNEATLVSVFTSCGHLGRLDIGRWVHSYINNNRVQFDVLLNTALLTMYAKCGDMIAAREVFDRMPDRSVVSWNSMIMGYGLHGQGEMAIKMFSEMERSRTTPPNEATLVCLLCSCAHSGMVLEGWFLFERMVRIHGIRPTVEHYGCVVDLFGRAGMLEDTKELIDKGMLPSGQKAEPQIFGPVLSACNSQLNWKLGEIVGKRIMEVEPSDVGCYVLLSNIYAAQGRWDDVEEVRTLMRKKGLVKDAGISLLGSSEDTSESDWEKGCYLDKKSIIYSLLSEMDPKMKSLHIAP